MSDQNINYSIITKSNVNDIFVYYEGNNNYRLLGKMKKNKDILNERIFSFNFPNYDNYTLELLGKDPHTKTINVSLNYLSGLSTIDILKKSTICENKNDLTIDLLLAEKTINVHALIIDVSRKFKEYDMETLPIIRLSKISPIDYKNTFNTEYPFGKFEYFCNLFQLKINNYKQYDIEKIDKIFSEPFFKVNIYKTFAFEKLNLTK